VIDVDSLLKKYLPKQDGKDSAVFKATSLLLKKLLHQDEINHFIRSNRHLEGFEFNDAVLDYFDFSFRISNRDREKIPDQGRVIIVANHPIGSLDGLALLKLVSEIRPDVKVVANTLLNQIDPLQSVFIALDNMSESAVHKESLKMTQQALEAEQAVIIFPTGEVSRIRPNGVRDGNWKTGFVHLARKTNSPVLPVYIQAKNSALFYSLSTLYKPLGTFMLVNEMFNKHDQEITFRIGNPVPWESMEKLGLSKKALAKRMRKQVYRLAKPGKKKPELFETVKNIVHPAKSRLIRKELQASELIGETNDGQQIYLFDYQSNSSVMREIGRLREISFRMVREGTGASMDLDKYDRYYRHLVLWDDKELEIVGAYRIGEARKIMDTRGLGGLYSYSLFDYHPKLMPYLQNAIELGRSFIQPRYWGKRSLDYLWYGIGAYLNRNPEIRYMFGPVSLSASYPEAARQLICGFYGQLFAGEKRLAWGRKPYALRHQSCFDAFKPLQNEVDYKAGYTLLKDKLDELGVRVPTLYKQYVELCHPGGCLFLDFNEDEKFANCIDGLILVDVEQVKQKKRDRYIHSHNKVKSASSAQGSKV
jgi:putative hemolysin